ncbi:phosphoglucosamine mutase [Oscillatoriales cyanobacterium LEGE 11467]|uniref:Phosphoglucosamine mutase n=1 Tax=Zarconia navalis LEGE 11467 TaxID=1828826 RepID=A0A928Z729_9CYAN|nr:phosphoglucosamine mutase [Zarconia navalis]MBE9041017.1 phosphoglucosamine mutase [Zarconia navalis LEGE 11467]
MVMSSARNSSASRRVSGVSSRSQLDTNDFHPFSSPLSLPSTPLFGTDGIRGCVGKLLTAPLAMQVGFWAGRVLSDRATTAGPIVLGQDSRNSGNMLGMALSAGLTAAGLDVWNIGLCPTPGVAYLACHSEAIGGVMISASHNPPEDNGIKFFGANGTKLSCAMQEAIEAGVRGKLPQLTSLPIWGQHHHRPELVKIYADSLSRPLLPEVDFRGLKIVLDLAWGAAANLAPQIFEAMGADVICLHDRPDGDRINVNCGSTHLEPLRCAVLEHQADMGFAFDGDADRVLAVDNLGRPVDGDYILYLWGSALQESGQLPNNEIITTVMANLGFERAWEARGGRLVRTAVGDRHVHAAMEQKGATLGGEQSGHVICSHYGIGGDGVLTALHLASLVRRNNVPLSDAIDNSFQTYPQLLVNVRVEDRHARMNWKKCEALKEEIARAQVAMGDRGRVLVRASGTEPVIRVMVEAATSELARHWSETLVTAVEYHLAS